ncbi:MAG: redoxin domain-containing protein [Bacteroidota bacterium]
MNLKQLIKYSVAFILLLTSSLGLYAQNAFSINGQIGKYQQGMITISYIDNNNGVADSSKVVDGKFSLKGKITEPTHASLIFTPADKQKIGEYRDMFLDPVTITIAGDSTLNTAEIKGGPALADLEALRKANEPIVKKGTDLDKRMAKAKEDDDQEKLKELGAERRQLLDEQAAIRAAFIKSHPDSYVAFGLWVRKTRGFIRPEEIEPEFNAFSARMKNSVDGKIVTAKLEGAKRLLPGSTAPDFTLNDVSGKPVSLSSLKGKNVVVVFWARNYFPFDPLVFAITKISRQLKDENLVILSVYFDAPDGSFEWEKVLEESALTAGNIINVKDTKPPVPYTSKEKSDLAKAFDLSAENIPNAYLISADGKILDRSIDLYYKDPVVQIKKALGK